MSQFNFSNLEEPLSLDFKPTSQSTINTNKFQPKFTKNHNMNCNIYLIAKKIVLGGTIVTEYYLYGDDKDNDTFITISEAESKQYTKGILASCSKLCASPWTEIPPDFIKDSFLLADTVIYQFSKKEIIPKKSARVIKVSAKPNVNNRSRRARARTSGSPGSSRSSRAPRSIPGSVIIPKSKSKSMKPAKSMKPEGPKKSFKISLCGFVCLKNLKDSTIDGKDYRNMYLDLICSKSTLGSNLIKIAEYTAINAGKNRLYLRSIYYPLPVYVHKGYNFVTGKDEVDLGRWFKEEIMGVQGTTVQPAPMIFRSPSCSLSKHARKQRKSLRGRSLMGLDTINFPKECTYLVGVNGELGNGVLMVKDLDVGDPMATSGNPG